MITPDGATKKTQNVEQIFISSLFNKNKNYLGLYKFINLEKERSIDVIITRLRKKIEVSPKNPKYLQTIRGTGYVLWIE